MTEYWKSNARKFCDFCKCWLADNKISISYHESGKRHKENVQNHISQLTKKSAKDHKQQLKIDDEMKKMEEAAMAAYLKDVQNNADLTSQNINKMLNCNDTSAPSMSDAVPIPTINTEPQEPTIAWLEVRADDDTIYYWNQETNETTWEAPHKYISLAQQQEEHKEPNGKRKKSADRSQKLKQAEAVDELKAFVKREKMKDRAVKPSDTTPRDPAPTFDGPVCGPAPRSSPYGAWASIPARSEQEKIDLQLPKTDKIYVEPPVVMEPEVVQFKERKVDSLGEGNVLFKKRKLNSNAKLNIRRKVDNDL